MFKKLEELGTTPAPWCADGTFVAEYGKPQSDYLAVAGKDEDARLIAAAPALYRSLREMFMLMRVDKRKVDWFGVWAALVDADAALAKAGGDDGKDDEDVPARRRDGSDLAGRVENLAVRVGNLMAAMRPVVNLDLNALRKCDYENQQYLWDACMEVQRRMTELAQEDERKRGGKE